jgi:hypothetical protein
MRRFLFALIVAGLGVAMTATSVFAEGLPGCCF